MGKSISRLGQFDLLPTRLFIHITILSLSSHFVVKKPFDLNEKRHQPIFDSRKEGKTR